MHDEWRWSIEVARASGRRSRSTNTDGCSVSPRPTRGWSATGAMPSARSSSAGPMPERSRIAGLWIAPAQRMHLAAVEPLLAGRRPRHDAGRAAAVDDDAVDQHAADDRQVRPRARRLEVAVGGRHATVRPGVDRVGRDAGRVGRVVVVGPRLAECGGRLGQRVVDGAPRPRAAGAGRESARRGRGTAGRRSRGRPRAGSARRSTSAHAQPAQPSAAQRSKSSGSARIASCELIADDPPSAAAAPVRAAAPGPCVRRASGPVQW